MSLIAISKLPYVTKTACSHGEHDSLFIFSLVCSFIIYSCSKGSDMTDKETQAPKELVAEKEDRLLREIKDELKKEIKDPIKESTVDYYNQNKDKVSSFIFRNCDSSSVVKHSLIICPNTT